MNGQPTLRWNCSGVSTQIYKIHIHMQIINHEAVVNELVTCADP